MLVSMCTGTLGLGSRTGESYTEAAKGHVGPVAVCLLSLSHSGAYQGDLSHHCARPNTRGGSVAHCCHLGVGTLLDCPPSGHSRCNTARLVPAAKDHCLAIPNAACSVNVTVHPVFVCHNW